MGPRKLLALPLDHIPALGKPDGHGPRAYRVMTSLKVGGETFPVNYSPVVILFGVSGNPLSQNSTYWLSRLVSGAGLIDKLRQDLSPAPNF